jgi:hypothetical protein
MRWIVMVVAMMAADPCVAQHPHCDLGKPAELSLLDPDFPVMNRFKTVTMKVRPGSCRALLVDSTGSAYRFRSVESMIEFVASAVYSDGGLYVLQRQCLSNYSTRLHASLEAALVATMFNFSECVSADRY